MPYSAEPSKALIRLFRRQKVVELDDLFRAIGTRSRMTVFRRLAMIGYLSSYSHAGRYYTLRDTPQFDENGLWQHAGAFFSRDGTLKETVARLVEQSQAGQFQRELQLRVQLRVHNTLADLIDNLRLGREPVRGEYLYISGEGKRARAQVAQRLKIGESSHAIVAIPPSVVIEVLIEIIHGSVVQIDASKVSSRLVARGIAVTPVQVEAILEQHKVVKKKVRSP